MKQLGRCFICWDEDPIPPSRKTSLIQPCRCKDELLKYAHQKCINRWVHCNFSHRFGDIFQPPINSFMTLRREPRLFQQRDQERRSGSTANITYTIVSCVKCPVCLEKYRLKVKKRSLLKIFCGYGGIGRRDRWIAICYVLPTMFFLLPALIYNGYILVWSDCAQFSETGNDLECAARVTAAFIHFILFGTVLFTLTLYCLDQIDQYQVNVMNRGEEIQP